MKKKIATKKTYKVEVIHYTDGTSKMTRQNTGFSVVELFGILSVVKANLMTIFDSAFKPPVDTKVSSSNSPLIHKPKPPIK